MGVIRNRLTPPTERFAQIANAILRDERLSFGARGLMGYLLSHEDGFTVTMTMLERRTPDGRERLLSLRRELEEHGYLVIDRARRGDGTLTEDAWTLIDPADQSTGSRRLDDHSTGTPRADNPVTGEPVDIRTPAERTPAGEHEEAPLPPRGQAVDNFGGDVIEFEPESPDRPSPPASVKQVRFLQRLHRQIAEAQGFRADSVPTFDGWTVAQADIAIREARRVLAEMRAAP